MRASTSATFGSPSNLFSREYQKTHKRIGSRSVSPSAISSSSARIRYTTLPESQSFNAVKLSNRSPDAINGISTSGSMSKIWRKRRKGTYARSSAFGRVFKVVFVVCLVLFLHALLGIGVRVPPEQSPDIDLESSQRGSSFANRDVLTYSSKIEHDHLGVDPDGHYIHTTSFNGTESKLQWRLGRKNWDYAHITSSARVDGFARPTIDRSQQFDEGIDRSISPHTPPPVDTPVSTRPSHAYTKIESAVPWPDLPLFELGDPVHALRIHLPASKVQEVPEEGRRGRRARARRDTLG